MSKIGTVVKINRNNIKIFNDKGHLVSVEVESEGETRTFHNDGHQIGDCSGVGIGDKVEIHPMPWPAAPYITKK